MKWTSQEQKILITIRQKYGKNCWQKIADELNKNIKGRVRTGRQCRDKYINVHKIVEIQNIEDSGWSREEQNLLYQLYSRQGSSWSNFTYFFPNKYKMHLQRTISSLRNKFYNKLKKFYRELTEFQYQSYKDNRNHISYQNIVAFLDLSSQLSIWIEQNGYIPNENSIILSNRAKIVKLIFGFVKQGESSNINQIVSQLKKLNKRLRCLGIFKNKTKKWWKITQDRLRFVLKCDSLIQNQEEIVNEKQLIKGNTSIGQMGNMEFKQISPQTKQGSIKRQSTIEPKNTIEFTFDKVHEEKEPRQQIKPVSQNQNLKEQKQFPVESNNAKFEEKPAQNLMQEENYKPVIYYYARPEIPYLFSTY